MESGKKLKMPPSIFSQTVPFNKNRTAIWQKLKQKNLVFKPVISYILVIINHYDPEKA